MKRAVEFYSSLLRHGTTYRDLGDNYFDERNQQATLRRSAHRIERLGYKVTLHTACPLLSYQ